jgi:uncharacterized protein HemY
VEAAEKALSSNCEEEGFNLHAILGMSYEKTGEFLKAVPELKIAATSDPDDEKTSASLVRCYKETQRIELMNQELARGLKTVRKKMRGF